MKSVLRQSDQGPRPSLPMRGEWIEMSYIILSIFAPRLSPCGESGLKCSRHPVSVPTRIRLSPCGESGLKFACNFCSPVKLWSLPMRGEWIEILILRSALHALWSLPMRGEWIEITMDAISLSTPSSLSPCGESGLKSLILYTVISPTVSLPMRGEWIEMHQQNHLGNQCNASLPMRGEWIEILELGQSIITSAVSPHAGRVD